MEQLYDKKREQLLNDLSDMSEISEDMLQNSIKALDEKDVDLAKKVINRDDVLDNYMITIEEEISRLLAFEKPLVSDARFSVALVNIANNLERIGDHATNIGEETIFIVTGKRVKY
jgi:phosphate transport system protein